MFEKLLSLLPYNPALAGQMAFYSRRMREESSIRGIATVFIVMAFLLQFFAVLSPPQPTLAETNNDLVAGGVDSATVGQHSAKYVCLHNIRGYQRIMHYYGISCAAFDHARNVTLHSSARDYYSMGHNPSYSAGEKSVGIDGAGTLYWRHITIWNQGSWDTYAVTNNEGKTFYIIKDCGNLVSVGVPVRSQLTPSIEVDNGIGNVPTTPTPTPAPAPAPAPTAPAPSSPKPTPTVTPCAYNSSLPASSPLCFQPCQYNASIPISDESCKPCDKSSNQQDTVACIVVRKTAANLTVGLSDANNTTAHPGDVIGYNLYAKNDGKATVKGFVFQENMNDVLDYASISDFHGGTIDTATGIVTWPAHDIKPGDTVTALITVKVKDPIPSTPSPALDPTRYDLTMTNVYGNAINIKLPGTPAKTVETASTTLPNTGPGTGIAIAALIVIASGYFYGRARLLAEESDLALKEAATA